MLKRAATNSDKRLTATVHASAYIRNDVKHVDHMSSSNRQAGNKIFRCDGTLVHQVLKWPQKKKNPSRLNQETALARELDHPSYLMLVLDSVQMIPDVSSEVSWSSICWNHMRVRTAGGTSTRSSGKTSCRNMLYVWPIKVLGRIYRPTKPLCIMPVQIFI